MGRRAKPPKGKVEGKRTPSAKSPKNKGARVRDLEERLAEALRLKTEALEQQAATAEILRVISRSPADVQPVFDAIARHTVALCDGVSSVVVRYDGEVMRMAAFHNVAPQSREVHETEYPRPPDRTRPLSVAILDGTIVHVPNLQASSRFAGSPVQRAGHASMIAVPLLRDGRAIGAIGISRDQPEGFSDRNIGLLQTFADQAVIAIENVRLFTELRERNVALTNAHAQVAESLDQQTATSEILRVISSSPTDLVPVAQAIADSAGRLCECHFSRVFRFDGELIHWVAGRETSTEHEAVRRSAWPRQPDQFAMVGRTILAGDIVHVHDAQADPIYLAGPMPALGIRSFLGVPMMQDGQPIGVIALARAVVRPFSEREIALVKTFADQAVIAMQNVRLFTELEDKNKALTEAHVQVSEALDQQTATSEILRAMSGSLADVQPVFDTIVRSGLRLLGGYSATMMLLRDGDCLDLVAYTSTNTAADTSLIDVFPLPLHSLPPGERAVHDRRPHAVEDVQSDPDVTNVMRETGRARGWHSNLFIPMIREEVALGLISITRRDPGPFAADEIALLQTFADQAVIAIENVRLFKELQEKNRALTQAHGQVTEALERQTATAEILRVISRSQADARPVFEAIAENAMRLFRAWAVQVYRLDGHWLHLEAARGGRVDMGLPDWAVEHEVSRASYRGQSILDRAIVHVRDVLSDPSAADRAREWARADGWRSAINAPMLLDSAPIGLITVYRLEPGGFLPTEVQLLQTFADQAVIAVENARLLVELHARTEELQHSVEQLTALGEVGRAVSSTLDLETVLTTIVSRAVELSGLDGGVVFEYNEGTEEFVQRAATEQGGELAAARRTRRIRRGEGVVGQTAVTLEPAQVPDILPEGAYASPLRENLVQSGIRAVLAVPMLWEGRLIGSLVVSRNTPGDFPRETVDLFRTFATQSALAIQNARLFHEIEDKSRELEAASRHKSEFLANMSHELRTPLNAIIGYSELLEEEAGDLDAGRLVPDLQKIAAAAQHQLSLINDILDLSKIEAGRMELELTEFDLPNAIDDALLLMRERASRRSLALERTVDEGLGGVRADQRKVKQVLLNLLSNAVKFTPERGRIDVRATLVDGTVEVSVTDTGSGIAPEDQAAVFEEFRQVGKSDKKAEGTGLGLALCRKFVELHGGRIWVQSQIGHGSTFTFTLPVRREE